MNHRHSVARSGRSTLVGAVLLTACGRYGSDPEEMAFAANGDPANPSTVGSPASPGQPAANGSNAGNLASGSSGASPSPPSTTGSGPITEGPPNVTSPPASEGPPNVTSPPLPAPGGEPPAEGEPPAGAEPPGEGEPPALPEPPVMMIGERPCDIYAAGGAPCVGAYSMVRLLAATYTGPLYQVRRGGPNPNTGVGGQTLDIGFNPDGFANAAAQNAFCGNQTCTVSVLYDQSATGNHLTVAPGGCYDGGDGAALEDDYESSATRQQVMVGGRNLYGLYMNPHEGYRNNQAVGTAEGEEPQGIYLLADGQHAGPACCWDFGTAGRDTCYGPTGIMNALMLGWGYWGTGAGNGPWMMADFELGVWSGGSFPSFGLDGAPAPDPAITVNPLNPSLPIPFAFGILTTQAGRYALRMGNATSGNLTTAWDGAAPARFDLKGAIILGVGGDNSNWSFGTFYEGAITAGRPTLAMDQAVFRNVQAAGYGR